MQIDLRARDITGEAERKRRAERFHIKKQYLAIGFAAAAILIWLTI